MLKVNAALTLFALLISSQSFADSASLTQFMDATKGSWSGSGQAQYSFGAGGIYKIQIKDSSVTGATPQEYTLTETITGLPHASGPTDTTYKISGDKLQIVSKQYIASAQLTTSSKTVLVYSTSHADPVTGVIVKNTRDMEFVSANTLRVRADIYSGNKLLEHFDYELNKK